MPKALISDSNQARNLSRWPNQLQSRGNSVGAKAGVNSQASSVAQLDAFTRKWLNLDISNEEEDSVENENMIKHPVLLDNHEAESSQQRGHLTPQPELESPKAADIKQKLTTQVDVNNLHVDSLDSVLTLLSSIKKDGAIGKEGNAIVGQGFENNEYFMLIDQCQSSKNNNNSNNTNRFPLLAQ